MESSIPRNNEDESTPQVPYRKPNISKSNFNINVINKIPKNTQSNAQTFKNNNIVVINNFINKKDYARRPSRRRTSKVSLEKRASFSAGKVIDNKNNTKRVDSKGNEIRKKGNQKIAFLDKISKKRLVDTVEIESFKEYNIVENIVNDSKHHSCCVLY